jgi:putative oxidoreductase
MEAGLLLVRLAVGLTVAAHGAQKLFGVFGGHGLGGTAQFLDSLRFRPGRAHAWLLALAEFGGGLLLALGWLTPLGAAAVLGVMVAAIVAVHASKGFFVAQGGVEHPLVIGAAAAGLAFTGPGRVSVDAALGWALQGTDWGLAAVAAGVLAAVAVLGLRSRETWLSWRTAQAARA